MLASASLALLLGRAGEHSWGEEGCGGTSGDLHQQMSGCVVQYGGLIRRPYTEAAVSAAARQLRVDLCHRYMPRIITLRLFVRERRWDIWIGLKSYSKVSLLSYKLRDTARSIKSFFFLLKYQNIGFLHYRMFFERTL